MKNDAQQTKRSLVSSDCWTLTLLQSGLVRRETAAKCEAYSDSVFLSNDSLSTESIWRQVSETDRERERQREREIERERNKKDTKTCRF